MTALTTIPSTIDAPTRNLYASEGYLAYAGLLSPAEVDAARAALEDITIQMLVAARKRAPEIEVLDGQAHLNFYGIVLRHRESGLVVQLEAGATLEQQPEELALRVRKVFNYSSAHPTFASLTNSTRLTRVIEGVLGQPASLFQSMALIKPPRIGSEKPWHQDNAYFSYAPLELIIGVWIALDEALVSNGCMHLLPGRHRAGAMRHYHGRDCEIHPERLRPEGAVPIELPAGGAMFFSGMLPHQTPPNRSPLWRRALQLHFRGRDTTRLEKPDYDRIFCEADGTPASCVAARI